MEPLCAHSHASKIQLMENKLLNEIDTAASCGLFRPGISVHSLLKSTKNDKTEWADDQQGANTSNSDCVAYNNRN